MSTCSILNLDKEPSKLFDKLVEVFGNQEEATIEYRKVIGKTFAKKFGDWEFNYLNPTSKDLQKTGIMEGSEPKLGYDPINDLHYFTDKNGDRMFVNKMKFSEFQDSEVKEVVGFLFNRFAKEFSKYNVGEFVTTQTGSSKVMQSIDRSIAYYKEQVLLDENISEEKRVELLEKISKVEKNKNAFRSELSVAISDLGVKVRERLEVVEEEKGGGVNIKDSFETSTKQSATVKTKIMLSTIERRVHNGKASDTIKDGYLESESYETLDNVWNTLNKILVDTVGYGDGNSVMDIYDLMELKMEDFADEFPFLDDLLDKLDEAKENGDTETLNGFVQAFSKTTVNYFVTEVQGGQYNVLNATNTNSRRSQITNTWTNNFNGSFLTDGKLLAKEQAEIEQIVKNLEVIEDNWRQVTKMAGTNVESQGYSETMQNEGTKQLKMLLDQLKKLGVKDVNLKDINMLSAMNGGAENFTYVIKTMIGQTVYAVNGMLDAVNKQTRDIRDSDGGTYNIFKKEKFLLGFAESVGFREGNINETSVLLNQGKTGYAITNPTYVSNTVNGWKNEANENLKHFEETGKEMDTAINNMGKNPDLNNSQWLNHLLARNEQLPDLERIEKSTTRINALVVGLDSSFTSKGRNDGVSNTEITTNDQINANISQLLNDTLGGNRKSMFPTIVAADKSRRILFEGFQSKQFGFSMDASGVTDVPPAAIDVATGYFKDEYNRMRRVNRENETLPADQQVVHYHGKDGNGTKSQIFPELSRENTDPRFQEFRDTFYNIDTFKDPHFKGITPAQDQVLRDYIQQSLQERVQEHKTELENLDGLSEEILNKYGQDFTNLAGDYFMNGLMASVEYTKIFSGDPAYYKNTADLIKRIPATYTDGLQLRLDSKDSVIFNQATVEGVEVASRYVEKIRESVNDKSIADAYDVDKKGKGGVNTTDAQAWITPRRWKFLKQKLGQWTSQHDAVFERMMSGETLKPSEAKLAAQPLKGVYFEINQGRPVYLKYSQAVLIPSLVKGTPMEALYNKMTQDADGNPIPDSEAQNEIHEVITIDGVKVGAVAPTRINKEGTTEMLAEADIVLNPQRLSNRGWKLQQDLPIKRMHDTNVGSQIQKNIFEGLSIDGNYTVNGVETSGADLAQAMHDTVSDLSDLGKQAVKDKFGIDENNVMTDTNLLYDALIQEFRDRGGNDNIVVALQKRMPFDAIPQIKGKVESILMSMMSREILKISTEGGSFIQVSPFGLETIGEDSGIIPLSQSFKDEGALLPPRIDQKTGEVLPGQAMIPHSQAVELLRKNGIDLGSKTMEEAMALLDPSALEMITYRIPNQGMSSNDYLEIVGVLPDGMGDSIVVYDGLPAKTGSDFDIDKLFAMQNHVVFNKESGKVEKLTEQNRHLAVKSPSRKGKDAVMYTDKAIDKMLLQNKLVSQYKAVLNSPATYDAMMRSIDGAQLKDDIVGTDDTEGLFPAKKFKNMELFSPLTQLRTKSDYISGKFGVGQTANMLVDHAVNQMLDVRMHTWLGVGNVREERVNGKKKLVTFFDTETKDTHSIADNLSAFLNAYVDIAKDPYIGRANHNAITANTTFMLLRAGAELKWVNRFIGQPIIRELVQAQYEQQSITANSIEIKGVKASPIDKVMDDAGIDPRTFAGRKTSGNEVSKLDADAMGQYIRLTSEDPGARSPMFDAEILAAWNFLSEKGKIFGESVVAAKSDTAGPGSSNVERLVNYNKIEKVLEEGVILGYAEKFGTADKRTMLGTYRENSLNFVGDVISNSDLFVSGKKEMEGVFNSISMQTGNGHRLTNLDLGKAIEANLYSYLMSGTDLFKNNNRDFVDITESTPADVLARQIEGTDNTFLNALSVEMVKDGSQFISLDSKNKPTGWQNDMYRNWAKLYNTYAKDENGNLITDSIHPDRALAIKLAKYSFLNSGFQNNLSQFFTSLPHQMLSDYNVSGNFRDMFNNINDLHSDSDFMDQFQRHSYEDSNVVKNVKIFEMEAKDATVGFIYKPAKYKSKELGSVRKIGKKEERVFPKFVVGKAKGETILFEAIGSTIRKDSEDKKIKVPIYARTFKLGKKVGKFKQFEYISGEKMTSSNIGSNNMSEGQILLVADFVANIKRTESKFKDNQGQGVTSESLAKQGEAVIEDMKVIMDNLDAVTEELNIKCK